MASIAQNTAFGIVTVMDVKVYGLDTMLTVGSDTKSLEDWYKADAAHRADRKAFNTALMGLADDPICKLNHLQVATLSTDGPTITINGGKFNNALIKYGKTARCEMTDALAQMNALVALGGADYIDPEHEERGIVVTDKFGAPVCMIGDSFVVDQATGRHVPVTVILYQFLPDSTPSFAFDSGNAATFDLNGDLLAVEFARDEDATLCDAANGVFFALEFNGCQLNDEAAYADITYQGDKVHGPNKMKIGQEYELEADEGYHAVALDLDSEESITVSDNKITVLEGTERVLISAEQNL